MSQQHSVLIYPALHVGVAGILGSRMLSYIAHKPVVMSMSINTNIKIIDYDDKYALDTVRIWRDSKEKALGVKDVHSFEDHLGFLRTKLIKENKVYLAIDERTDNVVGIMAIDGSELNQLYIHVSYQGMGIGSRLLNIAKELSPGKLQLFTFVVNKGAQTFYEKHGFTIIGRGYENEENLPDIRYEWVKD